MELFEQIRREYEHGTGSVLGVARKFGVHRRMVREALAGSIPAQRQRWERQRPRTGPVAAFIDEVLRADGQAPRRQRHTARRIYVRLRQEMPEHPIAESTVRQYVRERKKTLWVVAQETFVPQHYVYGREAQVDWYEAEADLDGERVKLEVFSMRSMASGIVFSYNGADELYGTAGGTSPDCGDPGIPSYQECLSYDGNGEAVDLDFSETGSSVEQTLTWDSSQGAPDLAVWTDDNNGTTTHADIMYGPIGEPVEQVQGTTPDWYYQDLQGNTRAPLGASAGVDQTYNYDDYGAPLSGVQTTGPQSPLGYQGLFTDIVVTGFVFMQARWYDPSTGQFISPDPETPTTLEPYSYGSDDPINETDPEGLSACRKGDTGGKCAPKYTWVTKYKDYSCGWDYLCMRQSWWRALHKTLAQIPVEALVAGAVSGTLWSQGEFYPRLLSALSNIYMKEADPIEADEIIAALNKTALGVVIGFGVALDAGIFDAKFVEPATKMSPGACETLSIHWSDVCLVGSFFGCLLSVPLIPRPVVNIEPWDRSPYRVRVKK